MTIVKRIIRDLAITTVMYAGLAIVIGDCPMDNLVVFASCKITGLALMYAAGAWFKVTHPKEYNEEV